MAEVFVSYSRADRARVEPLIRALENSGISVWWDSDLSGGERFSAETEARLNEAKAVVVAWSETSVKSMWVADEATVGRDKGNLVPISLDGSLPPIGFRQIQVIGFDKWRGEKDAPEIDVLVAAIRRSASAAPVEKSKPRRRFLWRRHPAAIAAVLGLVAVAAVSTYFTSTSPPQPAAARDTYRSIAVLPLTDISAAGDDTALADGIAAEVLNALARSDSLRVVARSSSFAFRDTTATIGEIGRALRADAVLEGTLNRSADRLKVSMQLVDAQSGHALWSDSIEGDLSSVFAIENEIAAKVASRLKIALAPDAAQVTDDLEAYRAFIEGRELVTVFTEDAHKGAKTKFEKAVLLDPDFAEAYAYLTRLSIWLSEERHGDTPEDVAIADAKAYLDKATALDPDAPMTIVARIHYLRLGAGDPEAGFKEAERGAKLHPNNAEIASYLALALGHRGDIERSIVMAERAVDLDPMSREPIQNYMGALARAGRRADILKVADDALERFPDSVIVLGAVGAWRELFGEPAAALQAQLKALTLAPDDYRAREDITGALYAFGFFDEAEPFIVDEMMRVQLMAMDPIRYDELRKYVHSYKGDIPPDVHGAIAYASGYDDPALIPEMEREAQEAERDDPYFIPIDLALAYKSNGRTEQFQQLVLDSEQRIAAAASKGFNSPGFWMYAALLAGAADNAGLAVERLDRLLALHSVNALGGGILIDPAFADIRNDPRLRAVAARFDAEHERQRREIIASGVLEELRTLAAKT